MNEEQRKKHLQQLDDASAIWLALKEVLDEATEMSVASAISDGVDSNDRHWRAGYAQAVTDVVGTLNQVPEDLVTSGVQFKPVLPPCLRRRSAISSWLCIRVLPA